MLLFTPNLFALCLDVVVDGLVYDLQGGIGTSAHARGKLPQAHGDGSADALTKGPSIS